MRPVTFRCPRGRLFSFKQKFPAEFSSLIRREFLAHLPVTARKRLFVFQHGCTMRTACRMNIDFRFAVRAFFFRRFHHYFTNFFLCWEYPETVFLSLCLFFYHSAVLDGLNICVRKINISWANSGMAASTSKVFHSPAFKHTV